MASLALAFDILARDKASKEFDKVGKSAQGAGSKIGDLSKKALAGLAKGAGVAAVGGVAALGAALIQGVKDAASYQKLADQTAAVLKSTGNVARQSVKGIQERAGALESMSGVDEEVIIHGQNVLATFTKIRDGVGKGNDIFNQATTAALNMSTALGTDMQGSAIQLGKALNDPVKGITALSRVGVSFTEGQKKQIAAMVKSGNTMGAQKVILAELNKEFGGAAKAAGQGFEGSMARAKDSVQDAFRAIGIKLLPVVTKMADYVAKNAGPAIDRLAQFMTDKVVPAVAQVVGKVKEFITDFRNGEGAAGALRTALATFGTVVQKVAGFLANHTGIIKTVIAAWVAWRLAAIIFNVTQMASLVLLKAHTVGTLENTVATKAAAVASKVFAAGQWLVNAALNANPIGLVVLAIAALVTGIVIAYKKSETFRNIVKGAFEAISAAARFMWNNVVSPVIKFLLTAFASVAEFYAKLLRGLSKIPGFGWAKGAADALQNVANKAKSIKDGIHDIPSKKDVTVNFKVNGAGQVTLANGVKVDVGQFRARAGGGPVLPGQLYQVGDNPDGSWNKTTELLAPTRAGQIINQQQIAEALSGGKGDRYTRLHPHDIAAIVDGIAKRPNVISAGSVDRALATGIR